MKTFEIMFDDLTEEAQRQFLEFQGLGDPEDGNYDIVPIAIVELEDDCFDSANRWRVRAHNSWSEQKYNEYAGLTKMKTVKNHNLSYGSGAHFSIAADLSLHLHLYLKDVYLARKMFPHLRVSKSAYRTTSLPSMLFRRLLNTAEGNDRRNSTCGH